MYMVRCQTNTSVWFDEESHELPKGEFRVGHGGQQGEKQPQGKQVGGRIDQSGNAARLL
jgi:hypothetical protein